MPWTPRCDALLDQSLGHGACKCLPRRAAHTYESNNDIHAGAANGARTKNKHTIAATHFAAAIASTAACRSTPNFAPTRALGALRCALVAACIPRALATFAASCAASWAAPNPHEAPTCPQVCYQRSQARRSRNNQACGAGCAPGGVRVVLANGHPETNTTTDAITLLLPSAIALATRRTWRTCRARLRAEQHRCNQLPSHRSSARCRTEPSTRPHRGQLSFGPTLATQRRKRLARTNPK